MDNNEEQVQTAGIMAAIKGYLDDRAGRKRRTAGQGRRSSGKGYGRGRACSRCGDDSTGPS